ncbi:MAG: GrdX family protein [Oscillospiraceae bacterium]|nr:GrdX family protein [Oscillospiraceae bacterium]
MNATVRIITNNPMVYKKYAHFTELHTGTVEDIFKRVRDRIHLGAVLINHPLSGSVKPNESPYKSLVVSAGRGALDIKSLGLIESALEVLAKLPERRRVLPARAMEDFQVIDLDLLDSAITALPAEYHI